MNKADLLRYIWEEKRQKIVSKKIYPLGVSIYLGNIDINCHTIIYGMLNLLKNNPEKGLLWSKNWGRTIVCVHPKKSMSFSFSTDGSKDEKLSVLFSSEKTFYPKDLLINEYNVGKFKILLNLKKDISLEGFILQVERMIDELVWCNFLELKKKNLNSGLVESAIYKKAVEEIWFNGVFVQYLKEDEILEIKVRDMSLPVRIYGNVLKTSKIPIIIGAALIPRDNEGNVDFSGRIIKIREEILNSINQDRNYYLKQRKSPIEKFSSKRNLVCCGITMAKEIHVGHVFLLCFAEMIRISTNSADYLCVDSNNVGRRIFGLVAKISEEKCITAEEVVEGLIDGEFGYEEISEFYKERIEKGEKYGLAKIELSGKKINVLSVMEKRFSLTLNKIGLQRHKIISESNCLDKYLEMVKKLGKKYVGMGFSFVKYSRGNSKKMLILEKQGVPTASAMRASFILKALSENKECELPIFIDASQSVNQAKDFLHLSRRLNMIQVEGAAIGFNMKIASGSKGDSITASFLFDEFEKRFDNGIDFIPAVNFFLLTRYLTAPSHKERVKFKPHKQSESFFDFKNHESFLNDFFLSFNELIEFNLKVASVVSLIKSKIAKPDLGVDFVEDGELDKKDVAYLFLRLKKIGTEEDFRKIFPKPVIKPMDIFTRKVFEMIRKQAVICDEEKVDVEIIQSFVGGNITTSMLSEDLFSKKVIKKRLNWDEREIPFLFVNNLRQRGYDNEEIVKMVPLYLKGEFCLIIKKASYFDYLLKMFSLSQKIVCLDQDNADFLIKSIELCLNKLGLKIGAK